MDYLLTEEQQMLRDLARQITAERIKPVRAELDEQETFPWDIIKDLAQADLCGSIIPEAYGGLGLGCMENVLVLEALAEGCVGVATTYAASFLGAYPLLLFGNEEQKQKYLPSLAKGEALAAFALTEAQAGSDAGAIAATAVKDGDDYIINGTKQWIHFSLPVEASFDILLAPAPDKAAGLDEELSKSDLDRDFYSGETVNLESILREQVLLTLPLKPLCSEACKGICPRCGADLNQETCQCPEEKSTSPFAVLKDIKP